MTFNMEMFQQFGQMAGQLGQMAQPTDMPPEERVKNVKNVVLRSMDNDMSTDLESCVHCGRCAEACHFYITTHDAKYTPIRKLDLMKRIYRRELSPMRWMHRLYTRDITAEELNEWQELVYDSCTECGRCSLVCPVGIHIAAMVGVMRNAYAEAGLVPAELRAMAQEQAQGTIFGVGDKQFMGLIEQLRQQGLEIPVNEEQADVMVLTSVLDIMLTQDALISTIKIMHHLDYTWTFRTDGFECANFGLLTGDERVQLAASKRIIDAAIACGAKKVIVAECGHSYPALRWYAAELWGKSLPFEVLAVSEFLGQEVKSGRLKVKPIDAGGSVTFHDPCKNGRIGGVLEEPRDVLKALGLEIREPESHGKTNICCGGGAGVFLINRAAPLRQKVFDLKREQIDATGSESLVLSCGSCRLNFESGKAVTHWDKPIDSLVELVGANLAE